MSEFDPSEDATPTTENTPLETGECPRVLDPEEALDARLPDDLRTALGGLLGEGSVETLGEWIAAIRRHVGGAIAVEDLCHAAEKTPHYGKRGDETHYFRCFYDAIVLSALVDEPVEIHTESPGGASVEARAVGTDELRVEPPDAVFSFGVADGRPVEGEPTHEDVYAAVCPYVRAFPDADAYATWAREAPAATVAMGLADATRIAGALAE